MWGTDYVDKCSWVFLWGKLITTYSKELSKTCVRALLACCPPLPSCWLSAGSFVSWLNLIRHEGHEPILRVTAWKSLSNKVKKAIESRWQAMWLPAIGTTRHYRNGHQVLSFSKNIHRNTKIPYKVNIFPQYSGIQNLV